MPQQHEHKPRRASAKVFNLTGLMPRAEDAESGLLSCICIDGADGASSLRYALGEGVTAAHFYDGDLRRVWGAASHLLQEGLPVDVIGLWRVMEERNEMTPVMRQTVLRISGEQSTTLHLRQFVAALLEAERSRQKIRAAAGLVEAIRDRDLEKAAEYERQLVEAGMFSRSRFPKIVGYADLVATAPIVPAELVAGVLHQGSKLMLGGGSKSFKSWLLIDLALSVATGAPWWGIKTTAARVLYCNFELAPWAFQQRVQAVAKAKGCTGNVALDVWNLRGHAADLGNLVPSILTRAAGANYGLILLDPIYKTLGDRDENAAGDIATLLNEVEALAVRSGAAVVFGHHFAKGAAGQKDSRDRVSGSGVWARDPDALVTVTAHEKDDHFSVEFVLRNFQPRAPIVVRWNFPLMEIVGGLDPAALKQPGRPREHSVDSLLQVLASGGLSFTELKDQATGKGMSEATFKRLLAEAKRAGLVEHLLGKWMAKPREK